jgi:hypothetical protein
MIYSYTYIHIIFHTTQNTLLKTEIDVTKFWRQERGQMYLVI